MKREKKIIQSAQEMNLKMRCINKIDFREKNDEDSDHIHGFSDFIALHSTQMQDFNYRLGTTKKNQLFLIQRTPMYTYT